MFVVNQHQVEDSKKHKRALIDDGINNKKLELLGRALKINAERLHEESEDQTRTRCDKEEFDSSPPSLIESGITVEHIVIPSEKISIPTLSFLLAHGWARTGQKNLDHTHVHLCGPVFQITVNLHGVWSTAPVLLRLESNLTKGLCSKQSRRVVISQILGFCAPQRLL